ncbi:MAG: hypothetical protein ABSC55_23920 [Syntrophorhabdales bacterium]
MRVAGKGNLDQLSQLWQLQQRGPAAQQQPSSVDRYKQVAASKDQLEIAGTARHQEKQKRSRMNPQNHPAASLDHRKQETARTGALTGGGMPNGQTGTQNTASFTSAVPLQPLGKYRQIAQSDQTAEMTSSIVVTG